ncbi:MAG TPA: cytochrome P450 [Herpetosiphonaceae bacterium]
MATAAVAPLTLPGPRHIPLLGWRGYAISFYNDPIAYMRRIRRTYGNIVGWERNHPNVAFAFGPEYNRLLLSDQQLFFSDPFGDLPAPPDSPLLTLRSGLLNMNGEKHKQQRRLMLPAFHRKHVESYHDDMVALTQRMLGQWREGQQLDLAAEMQRLTMSIATKTLFGLDVPPNAASIGGLIKRILTLVTSSSVYLLPYNLPGTPYREVLRVAEQLEATIRGMIAEKRARLSEHNDVLTMLIHARDEDGAAMSDVELVAQAYTLFLAGHETSSNALTWTLFLLSQHPRVLDDLRTELADVLHGEPPTVEQVSQLPLLERVIKESMRLLPPASFGARISTAPFSLGPYDMPKDSVILFSQYMTHHMPEIYSEPERFLPERWERITPSLYEYLPFGAGGRMCIGASFAMTEIKIVLALLLQRYGLMLAPNARIDRLLKVTLGPKHGMPMVVLPTNRPVPRITARGNIREMVDLTPSA